MASPSAACLGDDTVAAVLDGALPEEDARRAREHLGGCDACRRLVSAVVGGGVPVASGRVVTSLDHTVLETVVPGALIGGKYRIERLVGSGGMGQVFAARQLDLQRPVALKVLRPGLAHDAIALSRFAREARLASGLMSDGAVRIHELGQLASGEPYLVMELLVGEDLGAVLERGPVAVDLAVSWMISACEAIAEAHALGIVHRDLKPQNLFLARGPGGDRLKVLDFGLAKLAASEPGAAALTADGLAVGSPRYMAPEQLTGSASVDARADVWSLGATLHHLLAGTPPFTGENLHDLVTGVRDRAAPSLLSLRPMVGAGIAAAVARCLAKDPAGRFASAKELARALGTSASAVSNTAPTVGTPALLAGRYELREQLGAGGHGIVFRAIQQPLGREVAVKVLRREALDSPVLRERFTREALILQRLEHPNTVRLYDAGLAEDGAPFLVFELVRGRSLDAEIGRRPMPVARVARIASQLLKALMEAHAQGIVHRDVKPANVLIVHHAGEVDFVKLLDFGVARPEVGAVLTSDGSVVGTPRYMAPEQLRGGSVDARCDLYALGLVMAEALTGEPVYASALPLEIYAAKASTTRAPVSPALATSAIGQVIMRATQSDAGARFGSAHEMLGALEHATSAAGAGTSFHPPPLLRPAQPGPEASSTTAQPAVLTLGNVGPSPPPPQARSGVGVVLAMVGGLLAIAAVVLVVGAVFALRSLAAFSGSAASPPAEPSDNGMLANVNEGRLRTRIERRGLKVGAITRQDFGTGCKWVQLEVANAKSGGYHVFFFECVSRSLAANEAVRLRKGGGAWTVVDGTRVLYCGLTDEVSSRELCEALVDPALDAGRR